MPSRLPCLLVPWRGDLLREARPRPLVADWFCCQGTRRDRYCSYSYCLRFAFANCGLEQQLNITMQMIDARGRDSRAALGLRQNEGPLQNRLCMQRQAPGGPGGANPIALHRSRDVRFNLGGVPADARLARPADVGVSVIDLLHHGSDKTSE